MRSFKLPHIEYSKSITDVSILLAEHCLFTEQLQGPYEMPEHETSLGIIHSLTGDCNFILNGTSNHATENSFLVVDQRGVLTMKTKSKAHPVLLYFQADTPSQVAASLCYRPEQLLDEPLLDHAFDFSLLERLHVARPSLQARLRLLATLPESCSSFYALKADAVVRSILEELLAANGVAVAESLRLDVVKKSTRIELYKRLRNARDWMDGNFNRAITLQDIAEVAHLNSQHFLRMFTQLFQITPHQYLIACRLEEAKRLITTSDLSLTEVCNQIGWESLPSFSMMFKHHVGCNPSAFKKALKQ
jgi:AraC family transcriptional regulator